jgi:hypothetical protein
MTRPLTNPTPRGERGQGRKKSKVPTLRYGQQVATVTHSGAIKTFDCATVTERAETFYVLTFGDGTWIELKPVQ